MSPYLSALRALSIDLTMAARCQQADVVHSHTWYANFGGHLAKMVHEIPHVATTHSLEPLRPWKAEQLGSGYAISSWAEKTALEAADAVIAVSRGTRDDLLTAYPDVDPARVHVIYNGIDTDEYAPDPGTGVLERYGVDPARPSVAFVGRITRQKGVEYLLEAAHAFDPSAQLVLCAGSADTPQLGADVKRRVSELRERRDGVVWLEQMLPKREVDPAAQPRDGIRLPVDLRAARDRQPRGDGLRGGGRRHRDRRDRGGRPGGQDRAARADRAQRRRHRRSGRSQSGSRLTSRSASTPSSATPSRPRGWAGPDASARSSTSPGRRSPSRPQRCIGA